MKGCFAVMNYEEINGVDYVFIVRKSSLDIFAENVQ